MDDVVVKIGEIATKLSEIPVATLGDMAAAQTSLGIKPKDFQDEAGMGYQIEIAFQALHRKWPEITIADVRDLPVDIGSRVLSKVVTSETSPS